MKKSDKVMLSMKDLIFKKRPVKKLTERYIESYEIEEVVLKNAVKLKLLVSMRIYLVVNISRMERYRKLMKKQRVEEPKSVKVVGVKEQEVKKILNKRKVRGVMKYLVQWKEFQYIEKRERLEKYKVGR